MQVLLVLWLALMGMKDVTWDGVLEKDASVPASQTEDVFASDGPLNPPPPKP